MNLRERFHEVLNFNTDARSIKWEFGYWGESVNNWYEQGLPKQHPAQPATDLTTPTRSLYTTAWTCQDTSRRLPNGIAVMAGGLYWPTQGFPLDHDVRAHLGMDYTQTMVDVNLLFDPMFEVKILDDNDRTMTYVDLDGGTRIFAKDEATIPTSLAWPIDSPEAWQKLKEERLRTDDISSRFPANWEELVKEYNNRDYPLALGGYPQGLFGTLAHLIGYENIFMWYYTQPELIHDILNTFTELWLRVYEEVLSRVEVDHIHFWEDISAGKGPMVSLDIVREYMSPYIRRIVDFVQARGVKHILLDTDGDCNSLIPVFMEAGVTCMYPFETHCGMDIVKVRKEYPTLGICGGVPKSEIAKGRGRIDEILQPVAEVLKTGGFIPFGDHFIPPDVPWDEFKYYRTSLNDMIDASGSA